MSLTFLHPHMQTSVIDNSFVIESASGGGTALFMPYFSEKGVDNKLELLTSTATFLTKKGTPNYKRDGQAIYNVIQWLRGGGRVYGMRLLPDDAYFSNIILDVKTKAIELPVYKKKADGTYEKDHENKPIQDQDDLGEPLTQPGVDIKLEVLSAESIYDKEMLKFQLGVGERVDDDGYKSHKLLAVVPTGRGKYGNNISFRLSLNTTLEDTYDFRIYDFTVLEKNASGTLSVIEGPYQVSLFPEALNIAGSSMFIEQVVKNYCESTEVFFSDAAYDELIDDIMEMTKDRETNEYKFADPSVVDFLFGRDKLNQADDKINLTNNKLSLDYFEGIALLSGSDGELDAKTTAEKIRVRNKLLYNAYTGLVDPAVFNKRQFPIDVILDANFSADVKTAMAQFCKERKDCIGYLDTGILASPKAALSFRSGEFQESGYYTALYGQSFTVYDTFTSMDLPMTTTYFLAYMIPYNDNQYGMQYPIAGPSRGIIEGFKALDWNPNEYEKEDLYKARVNYIEQDYRMTKIMSNLTTQYKTSALSNINNVRVLLRMIRAIEEISENYFFEFANTATLNSFNANIANSLSEWVTNGACKTAKGTAYQSAYDAEQKICRVKIEVVFTDIIERILIEFNVGR